MIDDMKVTIDKFNGTNFAYWKMQIEDLLYHKNFYLPLGGEAKKPTTMSDAKWEVPNRKALGKVLAEHLNEFNTIISQLSSVNVQFEDGVWALLVLFSLPDNWNGMVTSLSNSSGSTKLKFDDVMSVILDEEIRRTASSESSGSAMNVGNRGMSYEREQSRGRSRSRSKSRSSKGKIKC
ncbi:hypothetical protein AAC387_Pa09g0300 [Persea americana]